MKGLLTGCGEIGNERKIQVIMEYAVTYGTQKEAPDILRIILYWRDLILFILEGLVVPHISIPYFLNCII
jgi:hypothetical protein